VALYKFILILSYCTFASVLLWFLGHFSCCPCGVSCCISCITQTVIH